MTVQIKNSKVRYGLSLLSLGFMGGSIYILMYIRYVFYDQMIQTLGCTNAQLGMLNTVCSTIYIVTTIPGAYLADKFDAKKIILFSISGITILTYIYASFVTSYSMAMVVWALQPVVLMPYWGALIKYINNLGDAESAGNSYGLYYLVNGLAGAFGNAFPLWISKYFGYRGAVISIGTITLAATLMVWFFLDSEKDKLARGDIMEGDEPIRLKYVKHVLKWPGTYIIFIAYLTTYTVYSNVSYFNPYLIDVIGIDPDVSSVYSVIRSFGVMVVAAPLGGFLADKVFKSTSKWFIVAFAVSAVMFAVPLLFSEDSNVTMVCIYSLLPSFIVFALYAVTYSITRELHIPNTVMGTAVGLGSISGDISDAVFPTMFGTWLDKFGNTGYTYIFLFLIGICVLGVLNSLWEMDHNKKCLAGKRVMNIKED